jgi:hypothetical protein
VDDKSSMADGTMETTQWQTCGSQVVDDKSLMADSTMDMARWQTCGSQVVDGKYLMTMAANLWFTSCG